MNTHSNSTTGRLRVRTIASIAGPAVAVLAAWLLSIPGDRDQLGVTIANVALGMAVITVATAMLDWVAGVATSIAAALSLNYFHTEPYRTLRITDRRDVYSVVLLGLLGLAVSAVSAMRVRRGVTALHQIDTTGAGHDLAAHLAIDRPAPEVWGAALSASAADLALVTTRVERLMPDGVPQVSRRVGDDVELVLPAGGGAVRLEHRFEEGRWLVLTPRAGMGPLVVDRRAVVALAEAVALALEARRPEAARHA